MTRREFTDQVLLPLTRLTWEEREAVRRELEEHLEDRMESMLERGWEPELAEERCLESMGDPAEIGREMAKQYRSRDQGWLWLGRAAVALTAVLCLQAVLSLEFFYTWKYVWDSVDARTIYVPEGWTEILDTVELSMALDICVPVGNDVLRAARVNVGREKNCDRRRAEVVLFSYDRIPGGVVSTNLLGSITVENQRGEQGQSAGGWGHYRVERTAQYVEIESGDIYVTLVYKWLGKTLRVQAPLPEEAS